MSEIFINILDKVCKGLKEPFRVIDVIDCLNNSKSFLAKHSIDPNNHNKKLYGNPYFIRTNRGQYKINTKYKTCP